MHLYYMNRVIASPYIWLHYEVYVEFFVFIYIYGYYGIDAMVILNIHRWNDVWYMEYAGCNVFCLQLITAIFRQRVLKIILHIGCLYVRLEYLRGWGCMLVNIQYVVGMCIYRGRIIQLVRVIRILICISSFWNLVGYPVFPCLYPHVIY
jgi:hypothetical protein